MCHPILGSITTDLVELKELVCILQGSNPFRPCPKCTVERTNLHEKNGMPTEICLAQRTGEEG